MNDEVSRISDELNKAGVICTNIKISTIGNILNPDTMDIRFICDELQGKYINIPINIYLIGDLEFDIVSLVVKSVIEYIKKGGDNHANPSKEQSKVKE